MSEYQNKIERNLETVYKTTTKIVLAQIFSSIGLISFGWFFTSFSDNSVSQNAVTLLWVSIIFLVILSFVLKRILFSENKTENLFDQEKLLQNLQNNTLFIGLLGIIIAVLVILVGILSGNKIEILRGAAAVFFVFLLNFPNKKMWEKIVNQKGSNLVVK